MIDQKVVGESKVGQAFYRHIAKGCEKTCALKIMEYNYRIKKWIGSRRSMNKQLARATETLSL